MIFTRVESVIQYENTKEIDRDKFHLFRVKDGRMNINDSNEKRLPCVDISTNENQSITLAFFEKFISIALCKENEKPEIIGHIVINDKTNEISLL